MKEYEIITEGYVVVSADSEEEAVAKAEQKVAEMISTYSMSDVYLQATSDVTCLDEME